jgi:hypothetical protein
MKYDGQHLKRLFDAYYACTQTQVKFEEKKEKYPLEFGVLLGGTHTQIAFNSESGALNTDLTGQPFSTDVGFTGGFFFDVIRPRNHRKWSFNNELVYTSYKVDRTYYRGPQSADVYDYFYTRLKYTYLKINTMVRFKYPIGKVYVFANAGISNGYVISGSDYKKRVYRNSWSDEFVMEGRPFTNGMRRYEFGFLAGLGVRYNRYAVEGRYDRSNGMLDYIDVQSQVTKLSFLLTYRLTTAK